MITKVKSRLSVGFVEVLKWSPCVRGRVSAQEVLLSAHIAWLSLSVTAITISAFLTQSYFLSWCRLCLVCITC